MAGDSSPGGHHHGQQSLLLRSLPKALNQVVFYRVTPDEPDPRSLGDGKDSERFGYNDDNPWQPEPSYTRWVQPMENELAKQVEYDMDEVDLEWLEMINAERRADNADSISYEFFEVLMDKLEKEWFDLQKHIPKPESSLPAEDSQCAICDDGECENSNAIVFCDGCNLAVHQDCYGVPYIPEGQWLCRKCTVSPDKPVSCVLCPAEFGAFKQTTNGKWAHLLCAIWINETGVSNTVYMEPVDGIELIPKSRWKLVCYLCKKRVGACIQCSKSNCYQAYHVSCAREYGLYMKLGTSSGTVHEGVAANVSYCLKHTRAMQQSTSQDRELSEELTLPAAGRKRKLISYDDHHHSSRDASGTPQPEIIRPHQHNVPSNSKQSRAYNKTFNAGPPIIPQYIYDKVYDYVRPILVRQKKKLFIRQLCRYWSLKRETRRGAPLLKRLHLEPWTAAGGSSQAATDLEKEKKLELMLLLRADLEKVRTLAELVRKREKEKLRRSQLFKSTLDMIVFPQVAVMKNALKKIQSLDPRGLFQFPVSKIEVPDYHTLILNPMDWTTISQKIDANAYLTVEEFKEDVRLVIANALLYNPADTGHAKAAQKLKLAIEPILKALDDVDQPASIEHRLQIELLELLDPVVIGDMFKLDYPVPETPVPPFRSIENLAESEVHNLPLNAPTENAQEPAPPATRADTKAESTPFTGPGILPDIPQQSVPTVLEPQAQSIVSLLEDEENTSNNVKLLSQQLTKAQKREAELAKKRADGAIYRAKKRAEKLARRQQEAEAAEALEASQNKASQIPVISEDLAIEPVRAKSSTPTQPPIAQEEAKAVVSDPAERTPVINEWGMEVDRSDVTNHDSFLLFNSGWVLPEGSRRRSRSVHNGQGVFNNTRPAESSRPGKLSVSPLPRNASLPPAPKPIKTPRYGTIDLPDPESKAQHSSTVLETIESGSELSDLDASDNEETSMTESRREHDKSNFDSISKVSKDRSLPTAPRDSFAAAAAALEPPPTPSVDAILPFETQRSSPRTAEKGKNRRDSSSATPISHLAPARTRHMLAAEAALLAPPRSPTMRDSSPLSDVEDEGLETDINLAEASSHGNRSRPSRSQKSRTETARISREVAKSSNGSSRKPKRSVSVEAGVAEVETPVSKKQKAYNVQRDTLSSSAILDTKEHALLPIIKGKAGTGISVKIHGRKYTAPIDPLVPETEPALQRLLTLLPSVAILSVRDIEDGEGVWAKKTGLPVLTGEVCFNEEERNIPKEILAHIPHGAYFARGIGKPQVPKVNDPYLLIGFFPRHTRGWAWIPLSLCTKLRANREYDSMLPSKRLLPPQDKGKVGGIKSSLAAANGILETDNEDEDDEEES